MTDAALLLYAACAAFAVFGYGCGFLSGHRAGRRIFARLTMRASDTHRERAVGTGSPKRLAEGQSVGQG